jgi:bifunctional non-homologous end joining protein LigD
MVDVTHADRVVFPAIGRTKGEVVGYYERLGDRALVHVADRPLSIRRFPKGLAGPGFFQKNVPPHYPASIDRFEVPRSHAATRVHARKGGTGKGASPGAPTTSTPPREVTVYPVVHGPEAFAYLANQGAIELHVPTARASDVRRPDRIVLDLDPPGGAFDLVRRAARLARDALGELGLETVPVATGSKGYHVVGAIRASLDVDVIALALHKFATWLAARHPEELTVAFRVASRGPRVYLDWPRNLQGATVVAPYSLRATPRATVAAPIAWDELERTQPDAFTIDDAERLVDRDDALAALAKAPCDAAPFVAAVDCAFAASGLVLEPFDRFRS